MSNLIAPEDILIGPRPEDLARCVHCGFCLQACPTYLVLGLENDSPRGRIQLARALVEDRIEVTPSVALHFDLCLACRACETACPSGVPYGRIIEGARALVQQSSKRPFSWRMRSLGLRVMFARPWRLRLAFGFLRLYQSTPLAGLMRRLLPRRLAQMEQMLPRLPRRVFAPRGVTQPSSEPRTTVAMLNGCVMPIAYPQTNEATVRVLARNGCRVLVPSEQGCCGALHLHNGDPEAARQLARRNIDVFLGSGADAIIVNSAGCGSTMKEYGELFAGDPAYAEKAQRLSAMVKDVAEFLVALPFEVPKARVEARVTYQDSCHLAHAQRIREAPRQLLRSIDGVEIVEMATPDRCCGSAGIYNMTQTGMSRRILDDKMKDVLSTGCDVIATANPGCMLQLELGCRLNHEDDTEVLHVVELLDQAYAAER
ncbi:MAG: glycolate oxidase subunit GlcF [Dehalococcoidia bacterium]|nr:glycolate oxidase subunit GlcF [Dehalococcoidia bacterium]